MRAAPKVSFASASARACIRLCKFRIVSSSIRSPFSSSVIWKSCHKTDHKIVSQVHFSLTYRYIRLMHKLQATASTARSQISSYQVEGCSGVDQRKHGKYLCQLFINWFSSLLLASIFADLRQLRLMGNHLILLLLIFLSAVKYFNCRIL